MARGEPSLPEDDGKSIGRIVGQALAKQAARPKYTPAACGPGMQKLTRSSCGAAADRLSKEGKRRHAIYFLAHKTDFTQKYLVVS